MRDAGHRTLADTLWFVWDIGLEPSVTRSHFAVSRKHQFIKWMSLRCMAINNHIQALLMRHDDVCCAFR